MAMKIGFTESFNWGWTESRDVPTPDGVERQAELVFQDPRSEIELHTVWTAEQWAELKAKGDAAFSSSPSRLVIPSLVPPRDL